MQTAGRVLTNEFRHFTDEMNRLLAVTVTQARLMKEPRPDVGLRFLSFGGEGFAPIYSPKYGDLRLSIQQICGTTEREGQTCLCTVAYSYGVGPADRDDPLFRWDYERARKDPEKRYCRHHLQGGMTINLGAEPFHFNKQHMPTGYVPVEEVLRFCIVDLGVTPLKDDWNEHLDSSYETFLRRFGRLPE